MRQSITFYGANGNEINVITIGKIRRKAIQALSGAGNKNAALDVDLLLAAALACDKLTLYLEPDRQITAGQASAFQAFLTRRLAHEPVAQILGCKEFWGLNFKVSRDCLTPRPESELLIEAALKAVPDRKAALTILDLGVGSGCLLLSLLSELPASFGCGVDLSGKALVLAQENAARLGLESRCEFIKSDWTEALPTSCGFDIILCNPPYIAEGEAVNLAPDVRAYEPAMALFAGEDGLDEYVRLAQTLPEYIRPNGHVFLEIGFDQGVGARDIFKASGAKGVKILPDLAGHERCLVLSY